MEHIQQEVNNLSKKMLHHGILFTDMKTLQRVIELKQYFSEEIIGCVEYRIADPRTPYQIQQDYEKIMHSKKAA